MINIEKGRYWDFGWQIIDGCTPCSPGCGHCWSAARTHRFIREGEPGHTCGVLTDEKGRFDGAVVTHPERLSVPLKRKKPAVYAIWNDTFHPDVKWSFIESITKVIKSCPQHTFLILTKRPGVMKDFTAWMYEIDFTWPDNVYLGLTGCTQQEADEKIPIFLQVPGKKFLSIEPCLGEISLNEHWMGCCDCQCFKGKDYEHGYLDAVILGAETGPGARPMHVNWVRSVRDQCDAAGVPFFLKSLGKTIIDSGISMVGAPYKTYGTRMLDGRTHDDLPWVKP